LNSCVRPATILNTSPKCLLLGDYIQDLYLCQTGTKPNPEDASKPALTGVQYQIDGGAGNVMNNLASFNMFVHFETPLRCYKTRLIDQNKHLVLRFDDEAIHNININVEELRGWLTADGNYCPTLVIADYAKGSITSELISMLASLPVGTFSSVFIDTKRSPQEFSALSEAFGNSCTFLPNKQEYDSYAQLYSNLPSIVRTESEDGVSYVNYGQTVLHVPATNNVVVSVCGAGDTVTAAIAASRANNLSWEQSLNVAMRAAGYVVGKPMTSSVPNGHLLIDYYRKINDRR
jgi:bifunctional ADP-heptose synthase (sugar kinase/adenylyltransferase)